MQSIPVYIALDLSDSNISGNRFYSVPPILRELPWLRSLDISRNHLHPEENGITHLPGLYSLNISNTGLGGVFPSYVFRTLLRLDISNNNYKGFSGTLDPLLTTLRTVGNPNLSGEAWRHGNLMPTEESISCDLSGTSVCVPLDLVTKCNATCSFPSEYPPNMGMPYRAFPTVLMSVFGVLLVVILASAGVFWIRKKRAAESVPGVGRPRGGSASAQGGGIIVNEQQALLSDDAEA
ncbi:hypothetical protein HK105_201418 [Polyrhizophydium stewartii]|uniref:Uncharacterized protein n=1 Tax=Polyrhizophydium stewartii TaxID=2732419 RepID=A0ABR4NHY7_9FUNG